MATISITREGRYWRDHLWRYHVWVDDREVARLRERETCSVDVDPGEHVVEIRMGLSGSPRMHIHLRRSDTVRLWCWPAASPWQWMGDMLHGWIALERSPEESMPRPRLWPVRKDELTRDWGFAEPGERSEPRAGPSLP